MNNTANVDSSEIEKFDRLAQMWWDKKGPMGMLHVINPLRVNFMKKNTSLKGKKILDVGCGGGILTEALAREGAVATGIDLAPMPIKIAEQHAEKQGLSVEYLLQNVESLANERAGTYDVVACLEALEHVPDPKQIIDSCVTLLKPDGCLFFSTINRNLKALLFAIIGAEYVLRILPRGTHEYSKLIKPEEIEQWSSDNGFQLGDVASFMYNPFSKTFKMRAGADVNYMTYYKR